MPWHHVAVIIHIVWQSPGRDASGSCHIRWYALSLFYHGFLARHTHDESDFFAPYSENEMLSSMQKMQKSTTPPLRDSEGTQIATMKTVITQDTSLDILTETLARP